MKFEEPEFLWYLLAAVPGLAAFFWWSWRKKRWLISQFVQSRLLAQLTVGVSTARQKARMALLVATVALLVIVLARPQWGFDWEEVRQRGLDIVIAIDTSKSMLAGDIPPNRLQRSKLAALDLLKQARTDRVGLVAFAGGAFLQCPLSLDDEAFKQSLEALNVGVIPEGGTALAEAIEAARSAFKEKNDNYKVVVIFSDGEDHDGRAVDVAKDAAKAGLLIFTVGVGTPAGEVLRIRDAKGSEDYIRDESGQVVKSRLNETLLREVAQASGGLYVRLGGGETLRQLYESRLAPLPKAELSARQIRRWHERYQWFLGAVIVLLLVEMFVPDRKRLPRSEAILKATSNAGLRKAVTVVALLALPAALLAASPGAALKQYESKRYGPAYREYQRLLRDKPNDPRLHYNAGASAYAATNYEAALEHLQSALAAEDLQLQQRAYYNLGNTEFRLGEEESDLQKREQHWQQATNSYGSALRLGTNDVDARFNLDLVRQKLEELKQQQQQQQQSKDDKQDQNDQKDQKDQQNKQDQQKQQDQQQQREQKQDQQQQSKPDEQQGKKPEDQPQSKDGSDSKDPKEDKAQQGKKPENQGDKPDQDQAQAGKMTPMQMTPQQAAQLLDAHKGEERLLLFTPQLLRTNRQNLRTKDW
jgi:Ca-activated chloride channel homolog